MNPVYLSGQYFLNHDLEAGELKRQVAAIAAAGYQNIYAHARAGLITPYLSDGWWESMRTIAEACEANGIGFSIWDEDYFPSGLAGDRIVWEFPELRGRKLVFTVRRMEEKDADGLFRLEAAALLGCFLVPLGAAGVPTGEIHDVTRHCGTVRRRWNTSHVVTSAYSKVGKIPAPHWRSDMAEKCFALQWRDDFPASCLVVAVQVEFAVGTHNSDLMNVETTRQLMRLTHDAYRRELGPERFSRVHSLFLDEPAPESFFPWTGDFAAEFHRDHGVDLTPLLPHLALDIDARSAWVRHAYRATQHRLLCSRYLAPVRAWAQEHGIRSIGHLTRTEYLYYAAAVWPEELRACRELDIPCCDPLGACVAWPGACAYHTGLKVVSSAAHIFGKEAAGSDALGVIGDETALRDMRFHLDYQMAMGITYFNLHGLSYSFAGPRKDEVPPPLFYQHPEWPWMGELLHHVRVTCAALREGEHLCGIGVLYPAAGIYCDLNALNWETQHPMELAMHRIAELLVSHQRDFDFIDETTLAECAARDPFRLPESWQVLIVPGQRWIGAAAGRALERFASQGGRVIVIAAPPAVVGPSIEIPRLDWNVAGEIVSADSEAWLDSLPGGEVAGEGARDILLLRRRLPDGSLRVFALNRAERAFQGMVEGRAVTLAPRESLRFDTTDPVPPAFGCEPELDLSTDWRMTPGENHLPLACWRVYPASADPDHLDFYPPEFNLLEREPSPLAPTPDGLVFASDFLYCGAPEALILVLDDEFCSGEWEVSVNGHPVSDWRPCRRFDCLNREASIREALHSAPGTPTPNRITVSCHGGVLQQMPRLVGAFRAQYRQAHRSLPLLYAATEAALALPLLADWNTLGFPAYAGSAVYDREFTLAEAGHRQLDLGRVEDLAEVYIDGRGCGVAAWAPYRVDLGELAVGTHRLQVTVACGPGNRERLAGLPAGWLGPVRLLRVRT